MNTPKRQSGVVSDSDSFHFTEAHDSVEVIRRPFPFDFLALLGLILLLPLFQTARETSNHDPVRELQPLVFEILFLTVMLSLSISIVRNQQRSTLVRWISALVAIPSSAILFGSLQIIF